MTKKEFQLIMSIQNKMSSDIKEINRDLDSLKTHAAQAGSAQGVGKLIKSATDLHSVLQMVSAAWRFARQAVDYCLGGYQEALLAETKLEAVLKSTGNQLGLSSGQLSNYASELQNLTGIDDDLIVKNMAMMATFTQIGKEVFPEAIARSADMTDMFGSMEAAVMQVGKALNDPIEGVTALRRVGVRLTGQQEEMIKSFMAVGDVASAQKIILKELKTEFGGVAEAIGNTFVGSIRKLQANIGDVAELVGEQIANFIKPGIDTVNKFLGDHKKQITNTVKNLPEIFSIVMGTIEKIIKKTFQPNTFSGVFANLGKVLLASFQASMEMLPVLVSNLFKSGGSLVNIIAGNLAIAIGDAVGKAFGVDMSKDKDRAKLVKDVEAATKQLGVSFGAITSQFSQTFDKYMLQVGEAAKDTVNLYADELTDAKTKINSIINQPLPEAESINQITGNNQLPHTLPDQVNENLELLKKVKAEIEKSFTKIENRYTLFGNEIDVVKEKHNVLRKVLEEMVEKGFKPQDTVIQSLKKDYKEFITLIESIKNPADDIFDKINSGLRSLDLKHGTGVIDEIERCQEEINLLQQALDQLFDAGYGVNAEQQERIANLLSMKKQRENYLQGKIPQETAPVEQKQMLLQKMIQDAQKQNAETREQQEALTQVNYAIKEIESSQSIVGDSTKEWLNTLYDVKGELQEILNKKEQIAKTPYQEYQEKWTGQMNSWNTQLQSGAYGISPETGMLYEAAGGLTGIVKTVSDGLGGMAGQILQTVATMGPLGLILMGVKLVLEGFFAVVGPAINAVLVPLISFLHTIGSVAGQLLLPVLAALAPWFQVLGVILQTGILPFLEMLSPIFALLVVVLNILLPIIKFAAICFEILMAPIRFVGDLFKWLGDWISAFGKNVVEVIDFIKSFGTDKITWHSAGKFKSDAFTGLQERIDKINAIQTDTNAPEFQDISWQDSTGYGQGAQYTQGRTINVNIYFYDTIFMGDPGGIRTFSLVVRDEIKAAEALGY